MLKNKIVKTPITLTNETKLSIEKKTGIQYDKLVLMDNDELILNIEKKIGKKLKFKKIVENQLLGRGSVYLYLNRLFDFNTKKLDRYIDNIKVI